MTWRFDCHVHSHHSHDGKGTVMELAEAAKAAGLGGFALTDHDTVAGHAEIEAASAATGVMIVPSVEVSSAEGHILAFNVQEAPEKGRSFVNTRNDVEAQGGLAVPAHPLRSFTGMGPRALQENKDTLAAIESRNARERRIVQENTERLVATLGLPMLAGSDAHWVKDIGAAYTTFESAPKDVAELLAMIRDGLCRPAGGNLPRRKVYGHGISLMVPKRWRK